MDMVKKILLYWVSLVNMISVTSFYDKDLLFQDKEIIIFKTNNKKIIIFLWVQKGK